MCAHTNTPAYTLRQVFPEASERFLNELRADWEQIVDRIKVGAKDRVGDWVDDVIRLSQSISSAQPHAEGPSTEHIWRTCA